MKKKMKISKSLRKYIRKEKAQIRRATFGIEEQRKSIQELYHKVGLKPVEKNEN